jgi:tellurite methyltransferase
MWKKEYKKENFYWGEKPSEGVISAVNYAKKGIALDIGAGEGRNSIYLAKNGFEVVAVEKIKEGAEKIRKVAEKDNLPIKVENIDIRSFDFSSKEYSLIISVAALDFLTFSDFQKVAKKIEDSLSFDGMLYLSVFSTEDPFFKKLKKENLEMAENNTFFLPKRNVFRHFFCKEELEDTFKNLTIIKNESFSFEDRGHGDPHFHDTINFIAQKKL